MRHDFSSSTIGPFGAFDDLSGYLAPEAWAAFALRRLRPKKTATPCGNLCNPAPINNLPLAFVLFAVAIGFSFAAEPEEGDPLAASRLRGARSSRRER